MISEILSVAATKRVSINRAATLLEDRGHNPISAALVVEAIEARARAHGDRPAGAYWDACADASNSQAEQ